MSEYEAFRLWSAAKRQELSGDPARELTYLREVHGLTGKLMEVCDAVHELGRGRLFSIWKKLRRYAHLAPDPLAGVRSEMRRIRKRYGE